MPARSANRPPARLLVVDNSDMDSENTEPDSKRRKTDVPRPRTTPVVPLPPVRPDYALTIKERYVDKIFSCEKVWEMRHYDLTKKNKFHLEERIVMVATGRRKRTSAAVGDFRIRSVIQLSREEVVRESRHGGGNLSRFERHK